MRRLERLLLLLWVFLECWSELLKGGVANAVRICVTVLWVLCMFVRRDGALSVAESA